MWPCPCQWNELNYFLSFYREMPPRGSQWCHRLLLWLPYRLKLSSFSWCRPNVAWKCYRKLTKSLTTWELFHIKSCKSMRISRHFYLHDTTHIKVSCLHTRDASDSFWKRENDIKLVIDQVIQWKMLIICFCSVFPYRTWKLLGFLTPG